MFACKSNNVNAHRPRIACHTVRIKDGHSEDHESPGWSDGWRSTQETANNWCSQYKASQTLFMSLPLSGRPRRELCKVAATIQGTTEDKAELAQAPRLTAKIEIKKKRVREGGVGGVGGATGATEAEQGRKDAKQARGLCKDLLRNEWSEENPCIWVKQLCHWASCLALPSRHDGRSSPEVLSRQRQSSALGDTPHVSTDDITPLLTDPAQLGCCIPTGWVYLSLVFSQYLSTYLTICLSRIHAFPFKFYPCVPGLENVFFSPEDQTVREGDGHLFQCVSGESSPPASITWLKNGKPVKRGKTIQVITASEMMVLNDTNQIFYFAFTFWKVITVCLPVNCNLCYFLLKECYVWMRVRLEHINNPLGKLPPSVALIFRVSLEAATRQRPPALYAFSTWRYRTMECTHVSHIILYLTSAKAANQQDSQCRVSFQLIFYLTFLNSLFREYD